MHFLYFKRWALPGHSWYKVGITNSPARRDAEQNVLPVPCETLALLKLTDRAEAFAAEAALHHYLRKHRITGADNRELFALSPEHELEVLKLLQEVERGEVVLPPVPPVAPRATRGGTPLEGLFTYASYAPSERKPEHVAQWEAIKQAILRKGPQTYEQLVKLIEPLVSEAQRGRGGAPAMIRYMVRQLGALVPADTASAQ